MKIAISNIAWNTDEDKQIVALLKKYSLQAIELAPTMIWKEPTKESTDRIRNYRKFWNNEGIAIVSIQSLLFGHPELTIFETSEKRKSTLAYIEKMLQVCEILGVKDIIFGSPRNRDRGEVGIDEAQDIATDFFYKVGELAQEFNIYFCIEPIPKTYGTNFINTTREGIVLVKHVNHPNFRLHLDSGALTINSEDYNSALTNALSYLQHFHISERGLKQIGTTDVDHKKIVDVLKKLHFDKWLSIEMRRDDSESNEKVIEQTLQFITEVYK